MNIKKHCIALFPINLLQYTKHDSLFIMNLKRTITHPECNLCCRLSGVIGSKPRDVKHTTKSESLLLQTYGQAMPDPIHTGSFRSIRDEVSTGILRRYHPVVLEELYPAKIPGDGNCFYRAVSRALSGTEVYHALLRVLTLLEILSFPMFYDSDHTKFVDLVQDNRIVVAAYLQLAHDVGCLGTYADMMHMYALSAALKIPIRSYFPPQVALEYISQPHRLYHSCLHL